MTAAARPAPAPPPADSLYSQPLEEAMLGAPLQDARHLVDVRAGAAPQDCYVLRHVWIFEAMCALDDRGAPVDLLTVGEELRARGQFDDCGGDPYLARLVAACPLPERAGHYARRVREFAVGRALASAADRIRAFALDARKPLAEKLAEADALLAGAGLGRALDSIIVMRDLMSVYIDDMDATAHAPDGVSGLATGFRDVDALLDGLQPDSLNYLAARPGMGKTALLLAVALHVALAGGRVYFWSGEMGRRQLRERLVSMRMAVRSDLLRRGLRPGGLTGPQLSAFLREADTLAGLRIALDDAEDMTPALLKAHVDMVAARWGGLDLICVDYIGLMEPGVRKENRDKELGYISRKLKRSIAKRAPVLCAAQLSRKAEERQDKRPRVSDLRDSGNLEQDADTVLLLYRDEVYNPNTETPTRAELIVGKNRHGAPGVVTLHFEKSLTRFSDARVQTVDLARL